MRSIFSGATNYKNQPSKEFYNDLKEILVESEYIVKENRNTLDNIEDVDLHIIYGEIIFFAEKLIELLRRNIRSVKRGRPSLYLTKNLIEMGIDAHGLGLKIGKIWNSIACNRRYKDSSLESRKYAELKDYIFAMIETSNIGHELESRFFKDGKPLYKENDLIQSETPKWIRWAAWSWKLIKFFKQKLPTPILIIIIIIILILSTKIIIVPIFKDTGSFHYGGYNTNTFYKYTSTTPNVINNDTLSQSIILVSENRVYPFADGYDLYYKYESVEIPTTTSGPVIIINEANNQTIPIIISGEFGTVIRNISSRKRYLQDLGYVLWGNKKISKPIGYGEGLSIFNINGNKIATTTSSILFEPNESKYLEGSFELIIWDMDTYNNYIKPNWSQRGLEISLLMKDSRGNIFDVDGNLISQKVIDSWWPLLFNKPSLWRFKDYCFVTKNIIEWRIITFLHWLK